MHFGFFFQAFRSSQFFFQRWKALPMSLFSCVRRFLILLLILLGCEVNISFPLNSFKTFMYRALSVSGFPYMDCERVKWLTGGKRFRNLLIRESDAFLFDRLQIIIGLSQRAILDSYFSDFRFACGIHRLLIWFVNNFRNHQYYRI